MTDEEFHEFCFGIKENNLSKFGIIKLSSLILEDSFVLSCEEEKEEEGLFGERMTLMKYAVRKGRDKIIGALIRGGCDPSVYPDINLRKSVHFVISLSSFPPGYGVWLVKFVYEMIEQLNTTEEVKRGGRENGERVCCQRCEKTLPHDENELPALLKWQPCQHEVCYHCTWETVCIPLQDCFHSLRCPICQRRCDGGNDTIYLDEDTLMTRANITPSERAKYSFHLWSQLPSEYSSESKPSQPPPPMSHTQLSSTSPPSDPHTSKRPVFLVGPLYEVSKYLIGTTQEQRLLEFHRSVLNKNIYRLYWIFLAGVDINGQNKYGQTALMIASSLGSLDIVKFLLWGGGDPSVCDHIHSTVYQTALSHDHQTLCTYFQQSLNPSLLNQLKGDEDQQLLLHLHLHLPCESFDSCLQPTLVTLIPHSSPLTEGRGSCYLDHCFSNSFLEYLDHCFEHCQTASSSGDHKEEKEQGRGKKGSVDSTDPLTCPKRYHLYDSNHIIRSEISSALSLFRDELSLASCLPTTFTDPSVTADPSAALSASTVPDRDRAPCHSILPMMKYLSYTTSGIKLEPHIDLSKQDPLTTISSTHTLIIYLTTCHEGGETILLDRLTEPTVQIKIQPIRGRMLIFPHHCPHEGGTVVQVPKLLLRCEAY
jgi:hypothetical protein